MGRFASTYGHFSENGDEYIITRPDTPRPWVNVISNSDFGLVVSQAGGGFSWRTHSNLNRLTRWNQDLIRDDWGKWLYLRDLESDAMRSLAYQPMQADFDEYQVRHGLGYSTFKQKADGLETEWTLFAAKDEPVEIWLCTIQNTGTHKRQLQLSSYFEWNLGAAPDNHREFQKLFINTEFDQSLNGIYAEKVLWEVPTDKGHWNTNWPYLGFHAASDPLAGWDTSKDDLLGRHGSFQNPKGIKKGMFSGKSGRFQDHAASLAVNVELAAGSEHSCVFLLGQIDKSENSFQTARALVQELGTVDQARSELEKVKSFWRELTGQLSVQTPDPAFDLLNNVWLKYQAISGHLWGRAAYYQQSGAFGFRDQLQTSQIWLPLQPQKMLEQAKLNARHQFKSGKVLHWWHPLTEQGLTTEMTDDLLWLPFMLTKYFNETADFSILQDSESFYDGGEATLQEHCTRAIDVVLGRFSPRGLPLIGEGDWCDGFSAVGLEGKGESIWLGMFLYAILETWSTILLLHSSEPQAERAENYRVRARMLKGALNTAGWNGQWYLGATKDDGSPIGDPSQEACKIYLNSQTWAIMSGVADGERQTKIADAVLEHLEGKNGTMLFQPGFSEVDAGIGYITRYAPSLRENGGVYTHAATWSVKAFAELGRAEDAIRLFNKLNPILQVEKDAEGYWAEPYVLPGNIDGKDSEYYGRAGWTWYTGAAGWLQSIALESICGIQPTLEGLKIDPCIPAHWPIVKIKRLFRNAVYEITLKNPDQKSGGVKEIFLNAERINGNVVPPQKDGVHQVEVILIGNQ
ncbi:MAG: glycosyl transferase family 36 [Calditrichaeota bacterium]|nr:MAG: glycosyl transferase family 36 [Calditrichota bacterium]